MTLLQLKARVDQAIIANEKNYPERNEMPVLIRLNSFTPKKRCKVRFFPLTAVQTEQMGVSSIQFGLTLITTEDTEM